MHTFALSFYTSHLVVLLIFLAMNFIYSPVQLEQDLDYDEGINLMKALLYQRGYALYAEIWSDQPPLLTVGLAGWFQLFGASVFAGRALILICAAGLALALHDAVRRTAGALAGVGAVLLLLISQEFIRLSSSVMIGLPALALAMISLWLLLWYKQSNWRILLVASALLLACAMQVKLLAATVVPAALLYLLVAALFHAGTSSRASARQALSHGLLDAVQWSVVTVVGYTAIGFFFGALEIDLLIRPHFDASTRDAYTYTNNLLYLQNAAQRHALCLLLAFIGALWALRFRKAAYLLPLGWFAVSVAALAIHRPLWHHHITLFTIPLCWLSAYGIQAGIQALRAGSAQRRDAGVARWRAYGLATIVAGAVILLAFYPSPVHNLLQQETTTNLPNYQGQIVERLRSNVQERSGITFTDRPYYAFQAHTVTPPETTVLSRKRLESGAITEEMLMGALERYEPQYVVLERFTPIYGDNFLQLIRTKYQLSLEVNSSQLYIRNAQP